MGHLTRTESIGTPADSPTIGQASNVIADLARGNAVDAQTLAQAKQALLYSLQSGTPAMQGIALQALTILFDSLREEAGRAELIGDLAVVGVQAAEVLAIIGRLDLPSGITRDEIDFITANLHLSSSDLLRTFLRWLAGESGNSKNGSNLPLFNDDRRWVLPKKESDDETENSEAPDPTSDPPDLEAMLTSDRLSLGERLEVAVQMGEAAIRPLIALLRDPGQQEFAAAALNHLGGLPETGRAVYQALLHLEGSELGLRSLAEDIRRSIDEEGGQGRAGARQRSRPSAIADRWLRSAIAQCNEPNILRAATGREAQAIPLVMRKLAELRTRP